MKAANIALFVVLLAVPTVAVVAGERSAASRMAEMGAAAADVPIASAADEGYCTPQLKAIVRRMATSCGLVEGGRAASPPTQKASRR